MPHGQLARLLRDLEGLIEPALIPLQQPARQESLRPLSWTGRLRSCDGDRLLEQRDRRCLGCHPKIHSKNFAQPLKLADRRLTVARRKVNPHESAACLLIGWVEVQDLTPSSGGSQDLQAASAQSLAMRLDPGGVTVRGQEVAGE